MSTRAQIIVADAAGGIWFYRHSDGYPVGVQPSLDLFCRWLASGKIRKDAMQAAGWLVMIGAMEGDYRRNRPLDKILIPEAGEWKVGAYEPCAPVPHGDTEFFYLVDVPRASWREITAAEVSGLKNKGI